jgi:uncharacterized membrane protein YfcA
MLPLLMLMDITALRSFWREWHWPSARVMMIWGFAGVILGAAFFRMADPDLFRLLIGAISLIFVAYQLAKSRGWIKVAHRPLGPVAAGAAGLTAGFTSFISHAGGPPVAVYLLAQGLSKTTFQATTVLVFWAINLFKVAPYAWFGIFTAETLWACVLLAPVAIAGTFLGAWAHRKLREDVFFAITYVFLTLTGSKLIWDALT